MPLVYLLSSPDTRQLGGVLFIPGPYKLAVLEGLSTCSKQVAFQVCFVLAIISVLQPYFYTIDLVLVHIFGPRQLTM